MMQSYGAAGIMKLPARLHVTWTDENTLQNGNRLRLADALLPFC
jgi:hypothetical protein